MIGSVAIDSVALKWLVVMLGGGVGTALRYAVSGIWLIPVSLDFPWGTLAVNISGSLALGFLGRYFAPPHGAPLLFLFLTVGVCGGYTTFSTFTLDTFTLVERGMSAHTLHVLASVAAAYIALIAGYSIARSIRPPL